MTMIELFRISFRSLQTNMMRSFLTMLGIIIGVATVIAMISIGEGANKEVTSQIQSLGSNLLTVSSSTGILKLTDAETLTHIDTIKYVAPVSQTTAIVRRASETTNVSIIGSTTSYADIKNWETDVGRFFTEDEVEQKAKVIVLGATTAESLFGTQSFDAVGSIVKVNDVPFRVIGILKTKGASGSADQDDTVIAPITTIQSRFQSGNAKNEVRQILVEANSANKLKTTAALVEYSIRQNHKLGTAENDFKVQSQADVLSSSENITNTLTLFLAGVAGISLLVGGIGIMNIMLVSVTERTREIGIRKAIGAKEESILSQFLLESIVLAVLGGVLGVALGYAVSTIMGQLMEVTTAISVNSVVLSVGFSALIGIVFGVFPARKAAKLNPIEALRFE